MNGRHACLLPGCSGAHPPGAPHDFRGRLLELSRELAEVDHRRAQIESEYRLIATLSSSQANGSGTPAVHRGDGDRWLTVDEAAALSGQGRRWFFRHKDLPFVRRVNGKRIAISERRFTRWLEQRGKR